PLPVLDEARAEIRKTQLFQSTRLGFVGTTLVIEDRVGAIEARARDALFVAEASSGSPELRVGFPRKLPLRSALQHQRAPSLDLWRLPSCSRSMLSNKARKFPAPKPVSPLRW